MARCVLCLRSDRPMTREHVFARWLVIKMRGGRLVPSDTAAADRIGRTITSVCADCNAGWMSVLVSRRRRPPQRLDVIAHRAGLSATLRPVVRSRSRLRHPAASHVDRISG